MTTRPENEPPDTCDEAIAHLLRLIEEKIPTKDLRRTDLRFRDLLSLLPQAHGTLAETFNALRTAGNEIPVPAVRVVLANIHHRVAAMARHPMERELNDGIRPALASDRDAACLQLLMGWVDGHLKTPYEVAAEFDTTPEHVSEIELHAHDEATKHGLVCPKLYRTIERTVKKTPVDDKWLATTVRGSGLSKIPWSVRALIATTDLLSIETGLTLMEIGDRDYLTLIADETYPQRVAEYATERLVMNGRATLSEIAERISAQIGQSLHPRDVRIAVVPLGVRWLDTEHETFAFK